MTREVVTLREEDDLLALQSDIDLTGHRAFPVLGGGDRVVGLVTYRDLLRATHFAQGAARNDVEQAFVAEIMGKELARVAPGTGIGEVAKRLIGHDAPCVLVIDENEKLVGIVSKDDVMAHLVGLGG